MYIICYLRQQSEYNKNLGPARQVVFKIYRYKQAEVGLEATYFTPTPMLFHLIYNMGTHHLYFLRLLSGEIRYHLSHCFWLLEFYIYRKPMSSSLVLRTSWVQIPTLLPTGFEHWGSYLVSVHQFCRLSNEHTNSTNIIWCHENYVKHFEKCFACSEYSIMLVNSSIVGIVLFLPIVLVVVKLKQWLPKVKQSHWKKFICLRLYWIFYKK